MELGLSPFSQGPDNQRKDPVVAIVRMSAHHPYPLNPARTANRAAWVRSVTLSLERIALT